MPACGFKPYVQSIIHTFPSFILYPQPQILWSRFCSGTTALEPALGTVHWILLGCQAPKQPANRNLGIHLFIIRNICNYTHLPTTLRSLHHQLLDVPPVGDTLEPVALGHANHANHLVLGEYRPAVTETSFSRRLLTKSALTETNSAKAPTSSACKNKVSIPDTSSRNVCISIFSVFSNHLGANWKSGREKKSPVTGSSASKRDLKYCQAILLRFSNTCNEGIRWLLVWRNISSCYHLVIVVDDLAVHNEVAAAQPYQSITGDNHSDQLT